MSRLRALETSEAAPNVKAALEGVQKKLGKTPNLMRTMANSPAVLDSYLGFSNSLSKTSLSPKIREQIALTVGEANRCQYCLAAHTALGKLAGLGKEEITDSRRGESTDPKTDAILRFASKIVSERGWVIDQDVESVRAAGLDDGEIAEVVAIVALNIFTNYANNVAEPDIDFPRAQTVKRAA